MKITEHKSTASKQTHQKPRPERTGTQSIERAAKLLRLVGAHQREGIRLVPLAEAAALDTSTTYRILKCLVEQGLIELRIHDKTYGLGLVALELGLAAVQRHPLLEKAIPAMKAIAAETGDTVYLVVRSGDQALCMHREEGAFPIKALMLEVGGRRILGAGAAGLHLMSKLTDQEIEEICTRNAHEFEKFRGLSATSIKEMVADARLKGYGVSRDRLTDGVSGVGIVIPSSSSTAYAAVSVAAISSRLGPERYEEVVDCIRRAVKTHMSGV